MHGIILAAGKGTRLRPYTEKLAKPALPFLNLPLMAYPLYYLEQLGLSRLIVNYHHLPETVESTARKLTADQDYELVFSDETEEILDSSGAFWKARDALKGRGSFISANGDAVMFFPHNKTLKRLKKKHETSDLFATLHACHLDGLGTKFGAIWIDDDRRVIGFGKAAPAADLKPVHFTGVAMYSDRIFDYLPEGPSKIFSDVIPKAIEAGEKVEVLIEPDLLWLETGDPKSYMTATRHCLKLLRDYQAHPHTLGLQKIFSRFRIENYREPWVSKGYEVEESCWVGPECEFAPGTKIQDFSVVGPNMKTTPNQIISSEIYHQDMMLKSE